MPDHKFVEVDGVAAGIRPSYPICIMLPGGKYEWIRLEEAQELSRQLTAALVPFNRDKPLKG